MLLDDYISHPDFRENHGLRIAASVPAVALAVGAVTPDEMPFLRSVTEVRRLPAALTGQELPDLLPDRPLLDQLSRIGFTPLGERPAELAWGIVGRLWKVRPDFLPVEDAEAFARFDERGWAKAAWNLSWAPTPEGGTELRTQTWVRLTDRFSRLRFRPYWVAAKPAGNRIRNELLAAIGARAEAAGERS